MDSFGPILWNFYGATETGLVTLAGPRDHLSRPGTIGRAVRGNDIRLLDDHGHEVPPGQVGELYARNSTLISGYHGNDEATQRRRSATASSPSETAAASTPRATTTSSRASRHGDLRRREHLPARDRGPPRRRIPPSSSAP